MTCINCGADVTGKYCSNCSQRLSVKRLTFKEGWYDFWARIYGFDGMFPRTFKDLTLRPGNAALDFISGNRVRYYGPVGYFFFLITCYRLLLSMLGIDHAEYMKEMQAGLPFEQKETKVSQETRNVVAEYFKLIAFIYIPFQAFAARYIFFRKQNLNFLEHAVLPLYVLGHFYWIQMIEVIFYRITGSGFGVLVQFVAIGLYIGYAYTSFIRNQSKIKVFFKGLGVYFLGYFLVMIVAIVIGMAIALTMLYFDPSAIDSIRPSKNP